MALKRTQSGKVDKRTKEYKEMKNNMAKARAAKKKKGNTGCMLTILPLIVIAIILFCAVN